MAKPLLRVAAKALDRIGYRLMPKQLRVALPDAEERFVELHDLRAPYSITSPERLYATYQAAKYVAEARIAGDAVECAVWHGGGAMMLALTLKRRPGRSNSLALRHPRGDDGAE